MLGRRQNGAGGRVYERYQRAGMPGGGAACVYGGPEGASDQPGQPECGRWVLDLAGTRRAGRVGAWNRAARSHGGLLGPGLLEKNRPTEKRRKDNERRR